MSPKRLVLMVEGEGDRLAAPELVKKLLNRGDFDTLFVDPHAMTLGAYPTVASKNYQKWRRWVGSARKRKNFGGCLLLLDGDAKRMPDGFPFCAAKAARELARIAREEGAGAVFSLAIVFACLEYESWLIAGAASLAGNKFSDQRPILTASCVAPAGNLEESPRDAKGWFRQNIPGGYNPLRDQHELTTRVDLQQIRTAEMRSFRRLEAALRELANAFASQRHVCTPTNT